MPADSPVDRLLRAAACVELDEENRENIRRASRAQRDWSDTIRQAELHGLAPYLYMRLKDSRAEMPAGAHRQLKALTFRHADASRIRTRALLEIVDRLDRENIEVLVLKGAALAHMIYERPGHRPMSDVDLLIDPARLDDASRIVGELGYRESSYQGLLPDHHHLPSISRTDDGLCVTIELHHDALAPDNIGSIRIGRLTEPPIEIEVDGAAIRTLGHVDMLRHLCRHALEPRETTKLGSALDILLYASRHADEIDWERFGREFPEAITMIRLLGHLLPWPSGLTQYVPAPAPPAPDGVGVGMVPLSRLRHGQRRIARLLNPSDWWLRAFYNVPPHRSLLYTKTVRHPARVAFWLWRRLGKAAR